MSIALSDLRKMSDADLIGEISRIVYTDATTIKHAYDNSDYLAPDQLRELRPLVDELHDRWVIRGVLHTKPQQQKIAVPAEQESYEESFPCGAV